MEQLTGVEKLVGELEVAVDRLRALYEQYFMGIEKIEPTVVRKDVDRRIYVMRKEQIRNTALRFRFQMILQRYNSYQTHWQRICREIENGTFKRHLVRAKQRFGKSDPPSNGAAAAKPEPGAALPAALAAELADLDREFAPAELEIDVDVEMPGPESATSLAPPLPPRPSPAPAAAPPAAPARPPAPGRPAGAPPPPLPAGVPPRATSLAPPLPAPRAPLPKPRSAPAAAPLPPPTAKPAAPSPPPPARPVPPPAAKPAAAPTPPHQALPEARVKQLYAQYVEAKRRQNESTAAVTYQAVAKIIQESGEKLRQKHGKQVDFEVAVKDGRAILKPVLK